MNAFCVAVAPSRHGRSIEWDRVTVFDIADEYLVRLAEFDPGAAALAGVSPRPLADLSPDAMEARNLLDRSTASALRAANPPGGKQGRLRTVMLERLDSDAALFDVGFTPGLLAPLATPLHGVRIRIESAPKESESDWRALAEILEAVPEALLGHRASLEWALSRGALITRRQTEIVARQVESWIADGHGGVVLAAGRAAPAPLRGRIDRAVEEACEAFSASVRHLREEVWPRTRTEDAVGDEFYAITSAAFLGQSVDLDDVANWGRQQVEELAAEAEKLATAAVPGAGLDEACAVLDSRDRIHRSRIPAWLSERVDGALGGLGQRGWSLPKATGDLRCVVTEAASGVMYYTAKSADGTTPATVWWTLEGSDVAPWRQVTTVHHEGVPGHHLQSVASASAELHPWQRHFAHVHGYAEGWAHHAEELADEFGLLGGPVERLGMVLGQLHRACRIVADTALHLDRRPGRVAGWDVPRATEYLERVARLDPTTARFEVDRYLGWPGQALAFRVGAREWTRLRGRVESKTGKGFDPAEFYLATLSLGPMGLGPLKDFVAPDNTRT